MKRVIYVHIDSCERCPYKHIENSNNKLLLKCLHSKLNTENPNDLDDWFSNKCLLKSDEMVEEDLINGSECM